MKQTTKCITIIAVLVLIILSGCTANPIIIERNITVERIVYNNTIVYINNTINNTLAEQCPNDTRLELIRRIKYLEGQQDTYIINETDCMPHNITEEDLEDCRQDIYGMEDEVDELEDQVDDLEDELDDCRDELEDCEEELVDC